MDRSPQNAAQTRVVLRSESGIAMLVVMMIGLVIMAMGVLAFQLSDTALTQSSRQVRREQLVHLAEHGIDQTLARLADDLNFSYYPTGPTGLGAYPGPFASAQAEKDWVRTAFQNTNLAVEDTPQGQFAVIKPPNQNVVYAASWIPTRASATTPPRIFKVEYLLSSYSPAAAVLSSGNLTISGSSVINGAGGNVHTNGNIVISGSPTATGDFTASGSASSSGSPNPPPVGGQPPQPVPEIDLPAMYEQRLDPSVTGNWYDLCPDGSVRAPAAAGGAPCTGAILESDATSVEFRGWKLSGNTWDRGGDDSSYTGVYYIYRKSAKVSSNPGTAGSPWSATILAEATETPPDPPGCPHGFGDIEISGNPSITPFLEGLGLMAGRDLKISGNPTFPVPTLMAAHEQVGISGNPIVNGAFVAEDVCDTASSPVDKSFVSGNPTVTFNLDLEVTLPGAVRTTLWLEL